MFSPMIKLSCVAVVLTGLGLIGCDSAESDSARADRQVDAALAAGDLAKANGLTGVSKPVRARVLSLLAADELKKANTLQKEIDKDAALISRLSWEMAHLAGQIRSSTLMAKGAEGYNPAPFQKTAEERIALVSGKDNPEWFKAGNTSVPSKAALEQRIAALDQEIKNLEALKTKHQTKRNDLLAAADALAAKSTDDSRKNLEKHKQAVGMRKEAGDLGVEIDKLNAQQMPLVQAADLARVELAATEKAIKDFQQHSAEAGKAWDEIRNRVAAQNKTAGQLATGAATQPAGGVAGPSIAESAALLDQAFTRVNTTIDDALRNLTAAADYAKQAGGQAKDYATELHALKTNKPESPQKPDWEAMRAAANPVIYELQVAAILRAMGSLHAARADILSDRASALEVVPEIFSAAKIDVPQALRAGGAEVRTAAKDAYSKAKEQVEASNSQLKELSEVLGSLQGLEDARQNQLIVNGFVLSRLYEALGDAQQSADQRAGAVKLAKDQVEKGRPLPTLPEQVVAAVVPTPTPPTPAPTPTPAPPATAPAKP